MPRVTWSRGKQPLHKGPRRNKQQQELEEVLKKHPVLGVLALIGVMACAWAPTFFASVFGATTSAVAPPMVSYSPPITPAAPMRVQLPLPFNPTTPVRSLGMSSPYQIQSQQLQSHGRQLGDLVRSNYAYGNSMRRMVANHGAAILNVPAPMP